MLLILTSVNAKIEDYPDEKWYNILSLDGGGIRGLISSSVVKEIEKYAFKFATDNGYEVPKYEGREGVVAMKDLFDMTAGTSTGSIISSALVYPDKVHPK